MDTTARLASLLDSSSRIAFFGGAGVSTESGIPDFRGAGGLYSADYGEVSPEQILSHTFYDQHPEDFFSYYRAHLVYPDARPNPAHLTLAKWEHEGKLTGVITQNVDGLHSKAGSRKVAELHGSIHRNHCDECGKSYGLADVYSTAGVPTCTVCGGTIKPDVVLYEESLPDEPMFQAAEWISCADTLIVAGTSLSVYPAASLLTWFNGDTVIIINRDPTPSDEAATLVIHDSVGETLAAVA